jgi:hypothetical protein
VVSLRFVRNLLVLLVLPVAVAANETDDAGERRKLAEAIRERIRANETARRAELAERTQRLDELQRLDTAIAGVTARRDHVQGECAALRDTVRAAEADLAKLKREAESRSAVVGAWAKAALPAAERLAEDARAGIPYRRATRAAAFDEIAALLAPGRGAADHAEGMRRLLAAATQELQLAGTREVRSERVDLGGGVFKHAYVARFGRVQEIFVTEDGAEAGIASRAADAPWRVLRDPEEVKAVTAILDCARRRREPELLPVPFARREGR